ncbi:hypothetical protein FEM48_Zijuj05G0026500 [Ziziphus jujuba var. spinosa]|uniref:Uncharacterized protein n=1 Tax=Ziziphus jujuba var. spinosa TaxID=714518 RepID=A0A978VCC1_ZIZJJ|nr:hypothetical protein FEM48_Zijuj05G0026500 [Ziziphus jujuba var. spinosa]
MGSQTELPRIPIIDFSKEELKLAASSSWLSLCNQIQYALENHGCFIAKYDQLSPELSKKIFSQTKDMFEVPTEIKMKNTSHVPYRGYHTGPSDPNMPRFEGLGIDNATSLEETQKFMNLMWPAGKDQLCEVVNSYAKLLGDLIEFIYEMVFESYGARKHYASFAASNSHVLRFLKLKPKDASLTTNIRFQSHKDLSFATIVHQIDIPGLEVQAKDGTWIAIQPQPSHFVFLASEAMQKVTCEKKMGSQTELHQIPVIDFSEEDLKPAASSSWLSLCNQVQYALENHGCFIAKYDQLSPKLSKKILAKPRIC